MSSIPGNLIETLTNDRVDILSVFGFLGGFEGSSPPVPEKQENFITMNNWITSVVKKIF